MVNTLLITNNFTFTKKLLEEINFHNLNIRIGGIASSKEEALVAMSNSNFQLILFDKEIKKYFDKTFVKDYKNSFVTLSYNENLSLINQTILKTLKTIVKNNDLDEKRIKIIHEMQFVGYKFKYKGTQYLLEAILNMYERKDGMVDNLQSTIYPILAKKYNKSIINIKSSINKATECMYCDCDTTLLGNYFCVDENSKPTIKQVIFTIVNRVNCF